MERQTGKYPQRRTGYAVNIKSEGRNTPLFGFLRQSQKPCRISAEVRIFSIPLDKYFFACYTESTEEDLFVFI